MKLSRWWLLCLFVCSQTTIVGQRSTWSPTDFGHWFSAGEKDTTLKAWQAQWIWVDEALSAEMILARGNFDLEEIPSSALLRISATSQYQLFVNGQYLCRGPARSAPHHQSYDLLEISSLLLKGQNTIAVKVHFQTGRFSYHFKSRAGFLAQLDSEGSESPLLVSGGSWKAMADPSWDNDAPLIGRFQMVVNDRVDFRQKLNGWQEIDFDDGSWDFAHPLIRNIGWPLPVRGTQAQPFTPPWTSLVPREVPYLDEGDITAKNLIQVHRVVDSSGPFDLTYEIGSETKSQLRKYYSGKRPLEVMGTKKHFLLFDFGKVVNGMPRLEIEGSRGDSIEIHTAPFVLKEQFSSKLIASEFRDLVVLSGSKDHWESTYFKPTRYLGIVVHGGEKALKIHNVGIHQISYPFEDRGRLESEDADWVQTYARASENTIKAATTDAYTDNYRERRQYAQTGYYASLGNYWTFGDQALQRRYLIQVAQEQEPNGMMPAYAPLAKDDYMIIMDSNCLWVRSLRNYFLHSGDSITARSLLFPARKLLELLHSYSNDFGMIDNPPYPYWLDHSLIDRQGANFTLNGHYLGALEDFTEVLEWLGESDHPKYQGRADLLRSSMQTEFWDAKKGLFADAWIAGALSSNFSEHAQAVALSGRIATAEQASMIIPQLLAKDEHNYIKRANGMTMVTPAMSYFLHEGLCKYGYIEESFYMFRDRFDHMLAPNTNGTLWEEWWLDGTGRRGKFDGKVTRSDAQTESAFAPALFGTYLLGIEPTRPGFREVKLSRKQSGLKHILAEVPTPYGLLVVEWEHQKNESSVMLDVPKGIIVNFTRESLDLESHDSLFLDEEQISVGKVNSKKISVGKHLLVIRKKP